MEININFNKKIEPLINSSEALIEWFSKNQEWMTYFELNHPGCLHFEDTIANYDIIVLGRMANSCLTWLESTDEEKVQNAVMALATIYEREKDKLSPVAKAKYFISADSLNKRIGK